MDGTPRGSSLEARAGLLPAHRSLWLPPHPSWREGVPGLPGITEASSKLPEAAPEKQVGVLPSS